MGEKTPTSSSTALGKKVSSLGNELGDWELAGSSQGLAESHRLRNIGDESHGQHQEEGLKLIDACEKDLQRSGSPVNPILQRDKLGKDIPNNTPKSIEKQSQLSALSDSTYPRSSVSSYNNTARKVYPSRYTYKFGRIPIHTGGGQINEAYTSSSLVASSPLFLASPAILHALRLGG